MFAIFLRFSNAQERAGEMLDAHKAWLQSGFSDGVFLAAGRIERGQGGAILANGCSREALDKRVALDPYVQEDVVAAEIIEFSPSLTDPRLAFLKEHS